MVKSYVVRSALHTELFFLNRRGRRERREEEKREEMFQIFFVVRILVRIRQEENKRKFLIMVCSEDFSPQKKGLKSSLQNFFR